ncbi:MAG: cytidylate kinase-like family protein [Muribaculum sp.]|nr:cytidylate kinase-like family protein [Muribaculum sp.]
MDGNRPVITIGRQFGSGGRELGRMLAERLGYDFYDKELLFEAARQSGMNPELFKQSDERFPRFLGGITFAMGLNPYSLFCGPSTVGDDSVNRAIADCITALGNRGGCVIVGRTADYVLRDNPNCFNIFVHAPLEKRIERILARGDAKTMAEAKVLAERTNKLRANYYNFYTDKTWGDASTYHLSVDSSVAPMERIVDMIIPLLGIDQSQSTSL